MSNIKISPSILSADFSKLGNEIQDLEKAKADLIHIDVMDGHFVPNITIGPDVVKALRPHSSRVFDVHLMISPVDPYIEAFAKAGADIITAHVEACPDLPRTLQHIHSHDVKAGVSLNPSTSPEAIDHVINDVDLILVMGVNPGFGGQSFINSQLDKIRVLRNRIDDSGRTIDLEIDGGINQLNVAEVITAGADVIVAGSATFQGGPDAYASNIAALRSGG